jgi:hypothetical protein
MNDNINTHKVTSLIRSIILVLHIRHFLLATCSEVLVVKSKSCGSTSETVNISQQNDLCTETSIHAKVMLYSIVLFLAYEGSSKLGTEGGRTLCWM